jgi:RNA polymerase sigma-70 factor (ECF subfamily)
MTTRRERRARRPSDDVPRDVLRDLAQRASDGDREAFGKLCTIYQVELLAFALRRLPTPQDAEDIVQQVYFKALRAVERRDQSRPFEAWLFHIAANTVTDFYRTRKMSVEFEPGMGGTEPSAESCALADQLDRSLEEAFDHLTARQRWVVRMRVLEDLDYDVIAARLGSSAGAVRAVQMRAMHHLRQLLEQDKAAGEHEERRSA